MNIIFPLISEVREHFAEENKVNYYFRVVFTYPVPRKCLRGKDCPVLTFVHSIQKAKLKIYLQRPKQTTARGNPPAFPVLALLPARSCV